MPGLGMRKELIEVVDKFLNEVLTGVSVFCAARKGGHFGLWLERWQNGESVEV